MAEGIVEFGVCQFCGRPIFFDWKGTFHVGGPQEDCLNPREAPEDDVDSLFGERKQ